MSRHQRGRDKPARREPPRPERVERGSGSIKPRPVRRAGDGDGWIWGWHAVSAALANPAREGPFRVLATAERAKTLQKAGSPHDVRVEVVEAHDVARVLPQGAAHQGVALRAPPLEGVSLEEIAEVGRGFILMLDQITDPQNVGAVFRSAAAFGAAGVVLQDRHAPQLTAALAKAAAGAIEVVPCVRAVNLSRALERLSDLGWRAVGLDGGADETLEAALDDRPTVLVLGSEGEGLRRLVAEHCDTLAKIPMPGGFESLNVSNAAAVAMYEASRRLRERDG